MSEPRRVLILGASGRDYHNFNTVYRDNPAYKDVAAKYKNDPKAEAMLVQKVMKGGAGVWGPVPMPANNISEADAKTLVKWVMSQK